MIRRPPKFPLFPSPPFSHCLWNRLVQNLTVTLASSFSGPGPTSLEGTVHLDVVVAAADGWSAVVTSGAPVPLQGGAATAAVGVGAERAAHPLRPHSGGTGTNSGAGTPA